MGSMESVVAFDVSSDMTLLLEIDVAEPESYASPVVAVDTVQRY